MRKRTAAALLLGLLVVLVASSLWVLRTRWAGERVCRAAAARVEGATGLRLSFDACSLDVFGLSVELKGFTLSRGSGPPVFEAEAVSARLAAVQALGRQIHLDRVSLVKPRLKVAAAELPAQKGGGCPPPFLSRFDIRRLEVLDGALDLSAGGEQLSVQGIEIRSGPGRRSLRGLAGPGRRTRVEVRTGPAHLAVDGRAFDAGRLLLSAEVARDLSVLDLRRAEVELYGGQLALSGRVENLCAPRLDLEAAVDGPVSALAELAGRHPDSEGTVQIRARIVGPFWAPTLSGRATTRGVRVGKFTAGDLDADLRLAGRSLVVDRLLATAEGGQLVARGTLQLERGLPLTAEAELGGVDLGEIIDRLGVSGPWVTMRLDGRGRVSGGLWPVDLSGEAEVGIRDFKVLTRSYKDGAGDPGILVLDKGRVETRIRIDRQGLYFDGARARVGRGLLHADAGIHFSSAGGFWVKAAGQVDLSALSRIAAVPWGGLATVEASLGAAPYAIPHVEGHARAEEFRFLDVDLGTVSADLRFDKPLLTVASVEGNVASARYRGEVVVDLFARPVAIRSASYRLHGRIRDLCDAVGERIPKARTLRDALEAEAEIVGTAQGPAQAVDLDYEAQLGPGTLFGRRFDEGALTGRVRGLNEARFSAGELRRGEGWVRGSGSWGTLSPYPMELELSFARLPLEELQLGPGLSGVLEGQASLSGSLAHPRLSAAATGSALAVHGLKLGAARLTAQVEGDQARFSLGAGGILLSAEAVLIGRIPFHAHAAVSLEDATALVEGLAPAGLRLRLVGRVEADGELLDWRDARLEAHLTELSASYADLRIEATGPAWLWGARGRWELARLTLEGPNTALTVSGAFLPSRELDGVATGTFDLRLLSGLVPALRRAGGQLAVEARLTGTPEEPRVVGSGKLIDGTVQVKGAPLSLSGVNGALAFSQSKVVFDKLEGALNGGRVQLKGEVDLAGLVPSHGRAEGQLEDVPVTIPGLLPATLSGRLLAEGTADSAALSGRLHVVRARYTSDVDLQGNLLKRRPPPPPKLYDRSGEWLRLDVQLAVDGDVRIENDLVKGPLSGELTLSGTLAAPGLVGSLAMGRGSQLAFRGNEFDLTHAVIEFTDRTRIQVALDVNGESQVRDYQVFLHVFGPLAEPHLKLSSVPDLPEQDIVTLLAYGFTRRDAGPQSGVSGVATATAAQALLSASGLDEQVKRFAPRGGPIRDLSMRIVTAYSEETGQVEPRAEFESRILHERLRLRFQAPLGAGRGRMAQAELKLGAHTAVQYQWDNESVDVPTGDHGLDLKLRWEWSDER